MGVSETDLKWESIIFEELASSGKSMMVQRNLYELMKHKYGLGYWKTRQYLYGLLVRDLVNCTTRGELKQGRGQYYYVPERVKQELDID